MAWPNVARLLQPYVVSGDLGDHVLDRLDHHVRSVERDVMGTLLGHDEVPVGRGAGE
jgi:hypothetical protein